CGWLIALASGWIAARFDRRLAAPAILLVGLATPIWFYSLTFWEHTLAALLALLAVAVALDTRRAAAPALAAVLALMSAASLLRLEMVAFAAALLGAWGLAAWRSRFAVRATPTAAGASSRRRWLGAAAIVGVVAVTMGLSFTERRARQLSVLPAR